jgi:hypothetical protein
MLLGFVSLRKKTDSSRLFVGPAGTLLKLLDRHPMRPAHIHLMVSTLGSTPTTQSLSHSLNSDNPSLLQTRHHPDLPRRRPLPEHRLCLRGQERSGGGLQAAEG